MDIQSFNKELNYKEDRIATKLILESSFSKEIRILLQRGQVMKEHKAPFPIIVHVLEGEIDFGVEGTLSTLKKSDIITLESNIPHDLMAKEDSVIRLTLYKQDSANRVKEVADKS